MSKKQVARVVPKRGEVWFVELDPVVGHEQGRRRPALVVSSNQLNASRAELVTVLPITTKDRKISLRVHLKPPNGGVARDSWVITEQVRTVSRERLQRCLGSVSAREMSQVENALRIFLDL